MAYVGTPIDTQNQFQSLQGKRFNGDASTTAFTLDIAPNSVFDIEVFVENVRQDPNSAYTLNGTTLTFSAAPPSGTNNIYVIHQAKAVGTITAPVGGSIDMNGVELILDEDGDTSITADTDDRIDFKAGNTDTLHVGNAVVTLNTPTDFGPDAFSTGLKVKGDVLIGDFTNDNASSTLCFIKSRNTTPGSQTIVNNGDEVGAISFRADDGDDTGYNNNVARIAVGIDAAPGTNDTPGLMTFSVTPDGSRDSSEVMRLTSAGNVFIGSTSPIFGSVPMLPVTQTANDDVIQAENTNGSFSERVVILNAHRSAAAAYQFLLTYSGDGSDLEHNLRGDGNAYADGSWNGGGADYAEYFEWKDGNTSSEDRVGYSVVLDGHQIRKATSEDNVSNIIGVISGNPAVVGDNSWGKWQGKHLKDDYGRYIYEDYTQTQWKDSEGSLVSYQTDLIPDDITVPEDATVISKDEKGQNLKRRKVNPSWNSSTTFIPREDRKEWSAVGLMGKLRIRKGQPTGDRWLKMRDISDTVEEWLIR